jgi:hypothetical protein
MSEEEIIKVCNKLTNDFSHFQEIRIKDRELGIYSWNSYDDVLAEYKQAIQGLLDLYEKEKEKNKNSISKDKIKPIQIIDLDGKIHNVYKIEEE